MQCIRLEQQQQQQRHIKWYEWMMRERTSCHWQKSHCRVSCVFKTKCCSEMLIDCELWLTGRGGMYVWPEHEHDCMASPNWIFLWPFGEHLQIRLAEATKFIFLEYLTCASPKLLSRDRWGSKPNQVLMLQQHQSRFRHIFAWFGKQ